MPQVVLSWPLSVRTMTSQRTSGDLPDERGSLPLDIDDVHILLQGQIEAFIEHKTTIKCCSYLIWCVIIYYKFDSIEMYIAIIFTSCLDFMDDSMNSFINSFNKLLHLFIQKQIKVIYWWCQMIWVKISLSISLLRIHTPKHIMLWY